MLFETFLERSNEIGNRVSFHRKLKRLGFFGWVNAGGQLSLKSTLGLDLRQWRKLPVFLQTILNVPSCRNILKKRN